jgi:thioredoxin 1
LPTVAAIWAGTYFVRTWSKKQKEKVHMSDNKEQSNEGSPCGSGGDRCCRGPGKWVWIVLALAVVGILVAKSIGKQEAPASTTSAVVDGGGGDVGTQEKAIPRLLDLGAGKCIPCKMMKPILDDLKVTYADFFRTEFLDVWENPDEAEKYGINMIPTQIFYDAAGKELFRHEGFYGKEDILAKWQELGVDVTARGETPKKADGGESVGDRRDDHVPEAVVGQDGADAATDRQGLQDR